MPLLNTLALFVMLLLAGCGGPGSGEPQAVSLGVAIGQVPARNLEPAIPEEIRGLPFVEGGKCSIDLVNGPQQNEVIPIRRSEGMNIDGWAFDDNRGKVPLFIGLQLAGPHTRYHIMLSRHTGRDDVAKAFGKVEYSAAGYSGSIDISKLPTGTYDIAILQKAGSVNLVCPTYRRLLVSDKTHH